MSAPIVCVVLDVAALGRDPRDRARALFGAGADWIQLRDRAVESAVLFRVTQALVAARDDVRDAGRADARGLRVIVNRRADVARAAGADGVHLGFDALAPALARRVLGWGAPPPSPAAAASAAPAPSSRSIGRSLHSPEEVAGIAKGSAPASTGGQDVDYVHLAPIWPPLSKPASRPPLGLAGLAVACRSGVPVFAQGGIDADRAADAVRAGAAGVALTGSVAGAEEPAAALAPIRASLDLAAASLGSS